MPLAVITCFFNHAGFSRPESNLRWFLRHMAADGIPVYGVEAKLATQPSVTIGMKGWKQVIVGRHQLLWQKEALLNLAEKMVPPRYDTIGWVDADVWFDTPFTDNIQDWTERLLTLGGIDIAQLFNRCHWTDERGKVELSKPSSLSCGLDQSWKAHPGFAWAMKRNLWQRGNGLYPFCIAGGGDGIFHCAFTNTRFWGELEQQLGANKELFWRWSDNYRNLQCGSVAADCYHMFHGTIKNRGYIARRQMFKDVDHARDLRLGKNGLVEWTERADPKLILAASEYFKSRKEDG